MRVLEGQDWKIKKAFEELKLHIEFKRDTLPILLTESLVTCISSGLYYNYGRDKSLCPVMIFCPKIVASLGISLEDAMTATHFVAQYIMNNKMLTAKVENWLTIIDIAQLGFGALPKKWIITFVKTFNHNYYQRNKALYLLNCSFAVRMVWAFVKPFLHSTTKEKINFEKTNSSNHNH